MQLTPNYNLKKPEGTDQVDIQDFNDNADIMDAELKKKADSTGGDVSNMTIKTLEEPTSTQFPVPEAGESSKTFFGKVRKFMNDFKSWNTGVCMIGQIVNNCVTNNDKLPLSAAQGKVLMDLYSVLNQNKAAISHSHDDRYFAEWEIEAKLKGDYCYTYNWSAFEAKSYSIPITGLVIATFSVSSNTLNNTTNGYVRIRLEVRRNGVWINGTNYDIFSGNSHYYDGAAISLVCTANAGDTLIANVDANTSASGISCALHYKIL